MPDPGLGVEEMHPAGVHDQLDVLTLLRVGSRVQPRDERRAVPRGARSRVRRTPVSRASSRVSSVRTGGASTVKCTAPPTQGFAQVHPRRQHAVGRASLSICGVLDVLGTDADDDLPPANRRSAARRETARRASATGCRRTRRPTPSPSRSTARLDHVHRRRPDEPADEQVRPAASYSTCGVSTCCSRPCLITATRSPIVIASVWSCVT